MKNIIIPVLSLLIIAGCKDNKQLNTNPDNQHEANVCVRNDTLFFTIVGSKQTRHMIIKPADFTFPSGSMPAINNDDLFVSNGRDVYRIIYYPEYLALKREFPDFEFPKRVVDKLINNYLTDVR